MSDFDLPRQPPRIPPDQAAEFDLVVDVKIMPRTSFDDARAYNRVRVPLNKFVGMSAPHQLDELHDSIVAAIDGLLDMHLAFREKADD